MGWADLLAAHQAHLGQKNSKFAWNECSAHIIHCKMIVWQVKVMASSWSTAHVSKAEGTPCMTSENSIQTPIRLSQEFVEKILKKVAPDMGGGKCNFWGVMVSHDVAYHVRWPALLCWRYGKVAETLRKPTRTVDGRWQRTWGQPAAQQIGSWISTSLNVRYADIYSYNWMRLI